MKEKNLTGISRVIVGTLNELLKIDCENKYIYLGEESVLPIKLDQINIMFDSNDQIKLDYMLHAHPLNIVHSFYRPFSFTNKSCGKILSIHDLRPIVHPEWGTRRETDYFVGPVRKTAIEADVIIAMSKYTKKDIVECYNIPEEKVKVVYSGLCPQDIFGGENCPLNNANIRSGNYILSVSAIDKNKNQEGLIKSFVQFRQKNADCTLKLVLVGPIRSADKPKKILKEYPAMCKDIIYTGYVSNEELVWLYRNAFAFMYVSFYEGFGLPILEAMSTGCAVICSNVTSMPEVGGDAVEYCNPYDTESIVNAIENVVLNEDRKKELENKAKKQAAKFSYNKAAKQTLEVYKLFQ